MFPEGSLFRLAKCLFPSVRAKEKKKTKKTFCWFFFKTTKKRWARDFRTSFRNLMFSKLENQKALLKIDDNIFVYDAETIYVLGWKNIFLFWFRWQRRSEWQKFTGLCCCEINMCAFISKFLIRKMFQPKDFWKFKKKKLKSITKIFDLFRKCFETFLVLSLSHMLFSCKNKTHIYMNGKKIC